MKRTVKILAVLLAVVLLLASCGGGLSGTYVSQGFVAQTFTFSGDQVTMSAFGINATGTYKISGNTITIEYDLFGQHNTWNQSFSRSGNTINIGGTNFVKS